MKRLPMLTLISGGLLLLLLVALDRFAGPHTARHPWLHNSIVPALALTTVGTAWYTWKGSTAAPRIPVVWLVLFIGGGTGFLEGNPATPGLYLVAWPVAVVALHGLVNWYSRSGVRQTV